MLNRIALPAYDKIRGRHYSKRRMFLEESQWWSEKQIAEYQFVELQKVLKAAFESVPFYQKKYADAGVRLRDIQSIDDLKKLPPLERGEIREHREEMRNLAYPEALLPHHTGGSSGSPTRFYITRESYDWRVACMERAYSWGGAVLGKRVLYLWGAPLKKRAFRKHWQLRAYESSRRQFKINTMVQPSGFWEETVRQAVAFKPLAIVAYTSNIESFCKAAAAAGVRIPSLCGVLAASETTYPKLYEMVENTLGVPLFNTYGSREFMSIALECDQHQGLHINQENILLENDDARPELNELLVTDLHNLGMPFIRYRIGDSAAIVRTPCACGRGLHRLSAVDGRVMDLLRTKDGRIVPPQFIPHVFNNIPEIVNYQAHQTALGHITIRLVLSQELSEASSSSINSELPRAFGTDTEFVFERVAEIPKRASGKRRSSLASTANRECHRQERSCPNFPPASRPADHPGSASATPEEFPSIARPAPLAPPTALRQFDRRAHLRASRLAHLFRACAASARSASRAESSTAYGPRRRCRHQWSALRSSLPARLPSPLPAP
jgi:phenylacetate-CoA ligase